MCSHLSRSRAALLLQVAQLYWEEGLAQEEIASRLGYSRPTVSRMLAQARRAGIVTVTVSHPIQRLMALEKALVQAYGLTEARVSEAGPPGTEEVRGFEHGAREGSGPGGISAAVARSAGELLLEYSGPRSVIAVSNGRAVGAVVHHLPERTWPHSTAVAMLGATGDSLQLEDGPDICRSLALRLGGHYRSLPVPLVFDSLRSAQAVREEDQVLTTLELAGRSDVALTGIGSVGESTSPLLRRWMTLGVSQECRDRGVVAHLCGHHLNASGQHVGTSLCDRTVCLDPERLRDIPMVIGVAAGRSKIGAIRAALAGGYLSGLATDEPTARALIAAAERDRARGSGKDRVGSRGQGEGGSRGGIPEARRRRRGQEAQDGARRRSPARRTGRG
ncbi:helix-turn-helix domain-containing protein [Actinomyces bowdenii]|uniref:sugar-binding transcriptional regulator n=1 Tax=Actinomyces bowdenii TaxID=131109 RepID=UPI00214BBBD5|nr:sugar-binding domain-containing protein [Actinomyces bowdenii]MCR2052411.1 helix-turn-helix domain-containing protein [Actinomyces bowdenii]